jgi:competence protein ComEC
MNWHEYPILRLVVPLIVGILYYLIVPQWAPPLISSLIMLLIVAFLAWPRQYLFPYKYRYFSGFFIYFTLFVFGITLTKYHNDTLHKEYFGHHLSDAKYIQATVSELPEEKTKSIKLIISVDELGTEIGHKKTEGLAVLYLQKDSLAKTVVYGDVLFFENVLKEIQQPQNPDEFNYKAYLEKSGVLYQAYLRSGRWQIASVKRAQPIKLWSLQIREYLLSQLQRHHIENAEFSVTAAMLLGVRSYLSPDLRAAFSGAGAMHILCVSGLHVGIIFMLLNIILGFMDKVKHGRLIRSIIILLSIWAYAIITGLSPSVVRAATMFSFISIGQNLGRHVNIYNSLAASAFVLLLVNPYLILDLGFQLSYSAVIAIVALQKPIQDLWTPRWSWLFKAWQLTTVSIAAQIGTAPLALYYFHSFPNYFLLTNLVVIPAAFVIFLSGITVIAFSWAGVLADYFAWLLSKMVFLLNSFIIFVEQLPMAVSRDIYINSVQLLILILLSIALSIMLIHKKSKLIFVNLSLIVLFLVTDIYQRKIPDQFIVYQTGKYDYISFIHRGIEYALTDADVLEYPELVDYQVKEHDIRMHIHKRIIKDIQNPSIIDSKELYRNKQFVSFDSLRIAIITPEWSQDRYAGKIDVDYLVFSGNPEVKMEEVLQTYACNQIIIAPSNAPWNVKKWEKAIEKSNIPIYMVKKEGAFVLDIK